VDAVAVGADLVVEVGELGRLQVLGEGNRPFETARFMTIDVDVDQDLGGRGSPISREVVIGLAQKLPLQFLRVSSHPAW
jgi:hypothetical protein